MTRVTDKDERTRSVLDPIHGLIRLTESEMKLVDSALFQRLRQIKQNGLLYLVFPGATHTRFEHSLGVLYVAHGMLNSLGLNSKVGRSKETVRATQDAKTRQAVAFPDRGSEEGRFLYEITRLAALAHDLGHGPLSHTFDSFAPTRDRLSDVLDETRLAPLRPLRSILANWGKSNKTSDDKVKDRRVPHEVMSCIFFSDVWLTCGKDPEVALSVCSAILGRHDGVDAASLLKNPIARKWVPLIHDIVASAPADADRMDYMERDSRSIGVTYGLFDRNRVLKSLLCYQDFEAGPRYRLGIKQSGLQAIENLMQARYELFAQIYYHKTNRAIARMLEAVAKIADSEVDLFSKTRTLDEWVSVYLGLTDEKFMDKLLASAEIPSTIQQIARDIRDRALWKRILDPTTREEADDVLVLLKKDFPAYADRLARDDTKPAALKDLDSGAALLIRNQHGIYEAGRLGTWSKESTIIRALQEADEKSARIYLDDGRCEDARKIRARALEAVFDRRKVSNETP